jgi:cytochrome c oxidase subunit II
MILAAGVFVVVWGLLTWSVIRYRHRREGGRPPQIRTNVPVEVAWTLVPALLVALLFGMTVVSVASIQAVASGPQVRLAVEAFRWGWSFRFPDLGVGVTGASPSGPEVELPVGQPIEVSLSASDVIHSFYVPDFLAKYDAIPGREHRFPLLIERPGSYAGECAEFCGIGHSRMPFTIRAVSPAAFEEWIATLNPAASSAGPIAAGSRP